MDTTVEPLCLVCDYVSSISKTPQSFSFNFLNMDIILSKLLYLGFLTQKLDLSIITTNASENLGCFVKAVLGEKWTAVSSDNKKKMENTSICCNRILISGSPIVISNLGTREKRFRFHITSKTPKRISK